MIITYPNEILRKKSEPVKAEEICGPEIKKIISEMYKNVEKADGVGLAAVQIGILKNIIIVEVDEKSKIFINPKITRKSWKKTSIEEACLSVPGKCGYVKRSEKISIKALDETGKEIKLKAIGIPAIIFQHEIDHLGGILFIDKMTKR